MKERGIYDESLIIYTSDHGDMHGDHNLWRKTYAYEGSVHIPMVIKPPKGKNICPAANTTPCTLYDILPTVIDFLDKKRNFYFIQT